MKHVSLLLIIVLAGLYAFAQQSLTIPYQALVRDANGNPVANQQIEAKITLLQDSIAGTEVFSEVHQLTTNSFGQMEIQIGSSDTTAFDNIDWSASKMYIKLEVDLEGGTNNQEIGTHQLLAVPYAKYAELDFETIVGENSDIYTRADVRRKDILLSIELIRQIMNKMPSTGDIKAQTPNVLHWKIPKGESYKKMECTRGEYGYYVVADGSEYPRRVNVRGPSYTHAVSLLEDMIIDQNIADVAGLMVSLHTYPPEIER